MLTDDERVKLQPILTEKFRFFNRGSKAWSGLYNWTLAASALFSGAAVIVLKVEFFKAHFNLTDNDLKDIGAVVAAIATLITTVSAGGGFGRKWQANRVSRGRIERLQIEFDAPDADGKTIRTELEDILQKHDEAIIGSPVK